MVQIAPQLALLTLLTFEHELLVLISIVGNGALAAFLDARLFQFISRHPLDLILIQSTSALSFLLQPLQGHLLFDSGSMHIDSDEIARRLVLVFLNVEHERVGEAVPIELAERAVLLRRPYTLMGLID